MELSGFCEMDRFNTPGSGACGVYFSAAILDLSF
jgi:hypothetical protein